MPVKFWTDEPEDTRSIEQMIEDQNIIHKGEVMVTSTNRFVGMRVKAGRDWLDQSYKPKSKCISGEIIYVDYSKFNTAGKGMEDWVQVKWDHDATPEWYRTGPKTGSLTTGGGYDLYVLND